TDTSVLVNRTLNEGKQVLFEGAHGTLLDIDFGTYPYVTSSNPLAGAVCAGIGLGPKKIDRIIGVTKAYTTRVGEGPFPTECEEELAAKFRTQGREYGSTTGRPRRIGWFDAVIVRKAMRLNGLDEIAITHLDVLDQFDRIPVCVAYERNGKRVEEFPNLLQQLADCRPVYEELPGWKQDTSSARRWEDLPAQAQEYITYLERLLGTKASIILVGPSREQTILR
nr:adenylosuccinate synthase [Armatimonadota bacterium]NIM24934.1 adenylosuccinate synthase [Armatimonadota bacterium]NIM68820.1 adenylosuccinate synthase [Armatimonadota bacterium]NIM77067.1 adenylosuccinate synthase [Armatimonadota bacterium]NIN07025.1 adenylosuccinate synthase [Armatimonadota bacterium]